MFTSQKKQQSYNNPAQLLLLTEPTAQPLLPLAVTCKDRDHPLPQPHQREHKPQPKDKGFQNPHSPLPAAAFISQHSDSETFPLDHPMPEGSKFLEQLTLDKGSTARLVGKDTQRNAPTPPGKGFTPL